MMKIKYPFQNSALDLETRINDLVDRMTISEKIGFIPTKQHGVKRLGIPPYDVGGEAAHGLVMRDGSHTTVFPQTIGMACSWNPDLLQEIGGAVGDEARAYYDLKGQKGGLTLWAPTVDLERDPRWGRTEEAYGEDPYLAGVLAGSYVRGMQGNHPFYIRSAAALKHFFANNNEEERCWCSVSIDPRNMKEYYWQSFKYIVEKYEVCCIMTAYNEINGTPAILNQDVEKVVKNEWGLPGFVVGDGDDFRQTVALHKYYNNHAESIADTLKSGVDCLPDDPDLVVNALMEALERGLLTEQDLDKAVKNIFRIRFRLGQFDLVKDNPYAKTNPRVICSDKHKKLALKAQRESIVLLKNENKFLPLDKTVQRKIAVIGPLADAVHMGWYTGYAPYKISILQGIREKLPDSEITYVNGLDYIAIKSKSLQKYMAPDVDGVLCAHKNRVSLESTYELTDWGWGRYTLKSLANGKYVTADKYLTASADQVYGWFVRELFDLQPYNTKDSLSSEYILKTWDYRNVVMDCEGRLVSGKSKTIHDDDVINIEIVKNGIEEAVKAAKAADIVILCVGNHPLINGKEEIDRPDITLPKSQQKLIRSVYNANSNMVLVLAAGYPTAVNWEDEHIPAIVYTANCCQELGRGIADVLFGDYNPAGRLNMTWYRSASQLPDIMDYDIIRGKRTYMYYEQEPLYPFGYGLSYTDFSYSKLALSPKTITDKDKIKVEFMVANTGDLAGDEVVQLYVKKTNSSRIPRPLKQLRRFKRVHLKPGQSKLIQFAIDAAELTFYDVRKEHFCVESGFYTILIGTSSADIQLADTFKIHGTEILPRDLTKKTKAENYDDYYGLYLHESKEGGTALNIKSTEGWAAYYDVKLPADADCFQARVSSSTAGGVLKLHCDSINGELLGFCRIEPTGSAQIWETVNLQVKQLIGVRDLYLRLSGDICLAWFKFSPNVFIKECDERQRF